VSDTDDTKFRAWIISICGVLAAGGITTVGTLLWQGNESMTRMTVTLELMSKRLDSLEQNVIEASRLKYTSSDALADKNAMLNICAQDRKAFMEALQSARNDCLELIKQQATTNAEQTARIQELLIFKAQREGKP